jgi:5'-methylthioadenosine phosphorylase
MTNMPEARLAREAEMCFATLALATDYDCWHETEEVSVDQILKIINQNVSLAQEIIRRAVTMLPGTRACRCGDALATAIITDRAAIPAETRQRLDLLLGRHLAG